MSLRWCESGRRTRWKRRRNLWSSSRRSGPSGEIGPTWSVVSCSACSVASIRYVLLMSIYLATSPMSCLVFLIIVSVVQFAVERLLMALVRAHKWRRLTCYNPRANAVSLSTAPSTRCLRQDEGSSYISPCMVAPSSPVSVPKSHLCDEGSSYLQCSTVAVSILVPMPVLHFQVVVLDKWCLENHQLFISMFWELFPLLPIAIRWIIWSPFSSLVGFQRNAFMQLASVVPCRGVLHGGGIVSF